MAHVDSGLTHRVRLCQKEGKALLWHYWNNLTCKEIYSVYIGVGRLADWLKTGDKVSIVLLP